MSELTIQTNEVFTLLQNKKYPPSYVLPVDSTMLAIIDSSYFDEEEYPVSDNITITFFRNKQGKYRIDKCVSKGNPVKVFKHVNVKMHFKENLKQKFNNPYQFSYFEGNMNDLITQHK